MYNWLIWWFIDLLMNSDNLRTSRLCAFVANKSSAFQAGFWWRFMPQNKFCGYENSAFQAKKVFNSQAHFCLKGNNIHNRRSPTCGQRHHYHCCLKGRTTVAALINICTGKKRTNKTKIRNLKFLFLYFPFLYFLLILNYGITPSKQSP